MKPSPMTAKLAERSKWSIIAKHSSLRSDARLAITTQTGGGVKRRRALQNIYTLTTPEKNWYFKGPRTQSLSFPSYSCLGFFVTRFARFTIGAIVTPSIYFSGHYPKIRTAIISWITIPMIDIFTSKGSFTVLLNSSSTGSIPSSSISFLVWSALVLLIFQLGDAFFISHTGMRSLLVMQRL